MGRGRSKSLWEVGAGDGVLLMSPVTLLQETKALASGDARYNVSKKGTLVIARPSAQDAGAYVCTATNAVGFSSQEMRLSVNSECWLPRPG